jgi:hypothetical protein
MPLTAARRGVPPDLPPHRPAGTIPWSAATSPTGETVPAVGRGTNRYGVGAAGFPTRRCAAAKSGSSTASEAWRGPGRRTMSNRRALCRKAGRAARLRHDNVADRRGVIAVKSADVRVLPALEPGESYVDPNFLLVETTFADDGEPVTSIDHITILSVNGKMQWGIKALGTGVPMDHDAAREWAVTYAASRDIPLVYERDETARS